MKSRVAAAGLLIVFSALSVGGVIWSHRDHDHSEQAALHQEAVSQPVLCLVGSEKGDFFRDPRVVKILADNGLPLQIQTEGSREMAFRTDLKNYDCAFPAGEPNAIAVKAKQKVKNVYQVFFSPVVIASWTDLLKPLEAEGIVTQRGNAYFVSDMHKLLADVQSGKRWKDLPDNAKFAVGRAIYPSSTDPLKSNSGQMYMALASYSANNDHVVSTTEDVDRVAPLMNKLVADQGYMESSSAGPFEDYATMGIGKAPLVISYESLFIEAALKNPSFTHDRVLLYPEPTVFAKHVLVPLSPRGEALGQLLTTNAQLREIATEYGFRTSDTEAFQKTVVSKMPFVLPQVLDVAEPPTFDMMEALLRRVADSRK